VDASGAHRTEIIALPAPLTRVVAADLIATHLRAQGLRYGPRNDEGGFAYLLYTTDPSNPSISSSRERKPTYLWARAKAWK
jgi:hypothetical protein